MAKEVPGQVDHEVSGRALRESIRSFIRNSEKTEVRVGDFRTFSKKKLEEVGELFPQRIAGTKAVKELTLGGLGLTIEAVELDQQNDTVKRNFSPLPDPVPVELFLRLTLHEREKLLGRVALSLEETNREIYQMKLMQDKATVANHIHEQLPQDSPILGLLQKIFALPEDRAYVFILEPEDRGTIQNLFQK